MNCFIKCTRFFISQGANDDDAVEAGDIEEFGEGCTNLVEAPVTVRTRDNVQLSHSLSILMCCSQKSIFDLTCGLHHNLAKCQIS